MDRLTAARVFLDIALSHSFTATAERLAMSRPMVTRHIEALEQWFGQRLLHRTTRKVSLTSAGEQYLPALQKWVDQASALEQQIAPQTLSGKIRIAVSMSFGLAQLTPALKPFMQAHPAVEIDIDVQDKTSDLVAERIDLALRITATPDPMLIGKPIAICDSILVASPAYLASAPTINSPEDLSQQRCLGYANFERHIWHLTQGQAHSAIEVQCALSANEATVLLNAALHGMGVSLQALYLAHSALANGRLVQVLPNWTPKSMQAYALYPSRKHQPPAVRALIDHLSDYYAHNNWSNITLA